MTYNVSSGTLSLYTTTTTVLFIFIIKFTAVVTNTLTHKTAMMLVMITMTMMTAMTAMMTQTMMTQRDDYQY